MIVFLISFFLPAVIQPFLFFFFECRAHRSDVSLHGDVEKKTVTKSKGKGKRGECFIRPGHPLHVPFPNVPPPLSQIAGYRRATVATRVFFSCSHGPNRFERGGQARWGRGVGRGREGEHEKYGVFFFGDARQTSTDAWRRGAWAVTRLGLTRWRGERGGKVGEKRAASRRRLKKGVSPKKKRGSKHVKTGAAFSNPAARAVAYG